MRISAKGKLLKLRTFKPGGLMEIPYDLEFINDMFVIGDRLFYFCTLPDLYYGLPKPYTSDGLPAPPKPWLLPNHPLEPNHR